MITKQLLSKLRCVSCDSLSSNLQLVNHEIRGNSIINGKLECTSCKEKFSIKNGIPFLIPEEKLTGELWSLWQDHLNGLKKRREPEFRRSVQVFNIDRNNTQKEFFKFACITEGDWIDIGCGPGKKRKYVENRKVVYYGIDPLTHPLNKDFLFCQSIAECIPFQDNIFDHVTAIDALDHFGNLTQAFSEISRVLKPKGKFHILQSINDITGPITAAKALAHHIKDYTEMHKLRTHTTKISKHMVEFNKNTLIEILSNHFLLDKIKVFSPKWYVPNKIFLTTEKKY